MRIAALWIRHHAQHLFNPLHVFCRLKGLGMESCSAAKVASVYERYIYRFTGLV